MSTRDIFEWKEVLNQIQIISDREEDSYSDIPGWDGQVAYMPTDKAVCLVIKGANVWFPFSQLRKAEDNASIYASLWILQQKDL